METSEILGFTLKLLSLWLVVVMTLVWSVVGLIGQPQGRGP